jgi:hypothetical protein
MKKFSRRRDARLFRGKLLAEPCARIASLREDNQQQYPLHFTLLLVEPRLAVQVISLLLCAGSMSALLNWHQIIVAFAIFDEQRSPIRS